MVFGSLRPLRMSRVSPWLVVGPVCILAGVMAILAFRNIQREREHMVRTLLSEARILMRSLEAVSRTAMMRMGWGRNQIQLLMEEAARQPDVLYVALVGPGGQIAAHSRSELVGRASAHDVPRSGALEYRFVGEDDGRTFQVSRPFQVERGRQGQPGHGRMGMGRHGRPERAEQEASQAGRGVQRQRGGDAGSACMFFPADPASGGRLEDDLYIVVGLDPEPFESSINRDLQNMGLLFGLLFAGGVAGFLALSWAAGYHSVRRSLQDMEAFTSTLVNEMPVGLLATDLGGSVRKTNAAARAMLHRDVEPGAAIDSFPSFLSLARQLETGEAVVGEEIHCRADGNHGIPLLVNAALIRDGRREPVGYVFLFSDLSNVKQLEEQLRRSERLAALGRLASGVAHEIRNPLSSIKGFAEILAGKAAGDPEAGKIARVMQQEVERLNRVITELLDFARPIELHKRVVSCAELLEHSVRLVERDAQLQGVRIESGVVPADLQAEVDPDRFSQVLLNLHLNALQAMEGGGSLDVGVRRESGHVVWTIADSGPGIAPESLPHIFDPYYTTKPRGVGLGLAVVHKLVEAHNGDIEVASTPGRGTTFTLRLPG